MFKKYRSEKAVSEIISIILMVAITIVLVSLIYYFLTGMAVKTQSSPKYITFSQELEEGKLEVLYVGSAKIKWTDLKIIPDGISIHDGDNDGYIDAGEYLYNCEGKTVKITFIPANILLGTWDFT